jgi:hypothetical protein
MDLRLGGAEVGMDAMEKRNVLPIPGIEHRFSSWSHWTPEITLEGSTCLVEERNGTDCKIQTLMVMMINYLRRKLTGS